MVSESLKSIECLLADSQCFMSLHYKVRGCKVYSTTLVQGF